MSDQETATADEAKSQGTGAREVVSFDDVNALIGALDHCAAGNEATVRIGAGVGGMLGLVAMELRRIRVALDHRNELLEESNALARERSKPPILDLRVEVITDGRSGTEIAKDFADSIGRELDRIFNAERAR